jgi:hypothetical protein
MESVAMHTFFGFCIIAAVWWHHLRQKKLRKAWSAWANSNGWSYHPERNKRRAKAYSFLNRLNQGHSRYLYHRVEGEHSGRKAEAFTFHYAVGHGKHRSDHFLGVVLIKLEQEFPEIRIHPENFFHKVGGLVGIKDLDLDSVEFSKTFRILSKDKKFAFDFCNTGMMELLLQKKNTALELEKDTLAIFRKSHLEPNRMKPALSLLDSIRNQMPRYLFQE